MWTQLAHEVLSNKKSQVIISAHFKIHVKSLYDFKRAVNFNFARFERRMTEHSKNP